MPYDIQFYENARRQILEIDASVRERLLKRIERMQQEPPGRHLQFGLPYFVIEVGQYRIVYKYYEEKELKIIYFIGTHKEYEKWYSGRN